MTSSRIPGQVFGRRSNWDHPNDWAHRGRDRLVAWNWSAKTNKPPTGRQMARDPEVQVFLLDLLRLCYDAEGKAEGEHGGWI